MVDITLQFAVKGKKADIADLFKRLTAMQNEGNVKFDYRTICLSKMIVDDCDGVSSLERVSPSCLTFCLNGYSYGWYLKSIRQALRDAYPDADIYFRIDVEYEDYPFVYDPEQLLIDDEYDDGYYEVDSDFDPRDDESWPDKDDLITEEEDEDDEDNWYSLDNEEYVCVIEYEATYVDGVVISGSFGREWDIYFGDLNGKDVFLNEVDDYTYLNGILYEVHDDDSTIVWEVRRESDAIRLGIEKSDFDCYDDWCEAVDDRRFNKIGNIATLKLVCTDKDAGSSTTTVIHTVHEFKKNIPLRFAYEAEVGSNRYTGKLELEYDDSDDDYYSAEAAFFLKDVDGKEIKDSDPRYERFFEMDDCDPVGRIYGAILEDTGLEEIKALRLSYIDGGC